MDEKTNPLVSIVLPVYNGYDTLDVCVQSVLGQTVKNFELIICDDGSTDRTRYLLELLSDDRIIVLHNPSNIGEGATRDRAIAHARGVWLAVIDADDAWLPHRLETLLKAADQSLNCMVFDDLLECHDTASGLIPWQLLRGIFAFGGDGISPIGVNVEDYVVSDRLLIKPIFPMEIIRKNKISHSDTKFGADTGFFLEILAYGVKLRYFPKAMYLYRISPNSASSSADRSALMRNVLQNTLTKYDHEPTVQNAIIQKIKSLTLDERYLPFISALRNIRVVDALRIARKNPWVIPYFKKKLWQTLKYHLHRLFFKGRKRVIQ